MMIIIIVIVIVIIIIIIVVVVGPVMAPAATQGTATGRLSSASGIE